MIVKLSSLSNPQLWPSRHDSRAGVGASALQVQFFAVANRQPTFICMLLVLTMSITVTVSSRTAYVEQVQRDNRGLLRANLGSLRKVHVATSSDFAGDTVLARSMY